MSESDCLFCHATHWLLNEVVPEGSWIMEYYLVTIDRQECKDVIVVFVL